MHTYIHYMYILAYINGLAPVRTLLSPAFSSLPFSSLAAHRPNFMEGSSSSRLAIATIRRVSHNTVCMYVCIYVCIYLCLPICMYIISVWIWKNVCATLCRGCSTRIIGRSRTTNQWLVSMGRGSRWHAFIRNHSSFSYQVVKLLKYMYSISLKSMYVLYVYLKGWGSIRVLVRLRLDRFNS